MQVFLFCGAKLRKKTLSLHKSIAFLAVNNTLSIYKASAGAGKTFTLTVEYILLLLRKGKKEFEQTLAVTFTNKATAEMKERILETLYGLSHNIPECDGYLKVIQNRLKELHEVMGEEMIRQRASEALSAILHDYTHFRVETIDSFFQSVLRNLATEQRRGSIALRGPCNREYAEPQGCARMDNGLRGGTTADWREVEHSRYDKAVCTMHIRGSLPEPLDRGTGKNLGFRRNERL